MENFRQTDTEYLAERNRNKFHGKHQCQLCPDKVIISDNDLVNHLKSAAHLVKEKQYYRALFKMGTEISAAERAEMPSLSSEEESEDNLSELERELEFAF